ncbi:hypothetical protein FJU31_08785 [Stenotrophomonas cyclobalanopsidis]|uniref:Uncharacterized protein n=1 Tax=Stenotrophomonas cyclobalanopsidis TaxID=2771362 RepID=A0ABQ6T214_9GAMM|nr:hypothetical protein FJU31_08785 [Stenotrophomonas cyclobalanopsidis]
MPCAQDSAHEQAATELTETYLQRPPQPDPPRHPSGSQLLLLLRLRLRLRQVQGAALPRPTPDLTHCARMR